MSDLWSYFISNKGRAINKAHMYFPAYERHFRKFIGTSVTMFELGVQNGGSAQMWKHYLGPRATIVGIDVDPICSSVAEDHIHVRIGSQDDPAFLQGVIDEFGIPDLVLDDASHQMKHVNASFDFLFPRMGKNSVYMVEDLCCAYWDEYGGGRESPQSFVNRAKGLVDKLNAHHTRGSVCPDWFTETVASIHFYESIVCLEKHPRISGCAFTGDIAVAWDPRIPERR